VVLQWGGKTTGRGELIRRKQKGYVFNNKKKFEQGGKKTPRSKEGMPETEAKTPPHREEGRLPLENALGGETRDPGHTLGEPRLEKPP